MIRTQISLDEKEYRRAQRHAADLGISLAEFVRRAVREALPPSDKPWMKFIGMIEGGDPHVSAHIDDVVYGTKD